MKNQLLGFVLLFLFASSFSLNAQQKLDAGKISYEITNIISDSPESSQIKDMLQGSTMNVYFKDGKSLIRVDMMGSMVVSDVVIDNEGSSKIYMDMMGNKVMVNVPKHSGEELDAKKADITFTHDDTDTKQILGHDCKKVIIGSSSNDAFKVHAYYTDKYIADLQLIQNIDLSALKGIPLQYTMGSGGGLAFEYTAREILETLDEDPFQYDESLYQEMSFADFQAQMGGMFGF